MWNKYCISVYLNHDNNFNNLEQYLKLASEYECDEIFTSAHVPENKFEEQFNFIEKLSYYVHKYKMELTVDFGGVSLYRLIESKSNYSSMVIDNIRLDCGYDEHVMELIDKELNVKSFVLNASVLNGEDIDNYYHVIKKNKYKVKACHNFYPRKETGLDLEFVLSQNKMFHSKGISVMTCVANSNKPRGPLFMGLPTIENQRNLTLEQALLDCFNDEIADEILIGDEWLEEEQFEILKNLKKDKILKVNINLNKNISDREKTIVLSNCHSFRYDSNSYILRSETSRTMAEYAVEINELNTINRKRGAITIDNKLYKRYSGEMEIVLRDLPKDERVNVVGYVTEDDIYKLNSYRYGFKYYFEEGE